MQEETKELVEIEIYVFMNSTCQSFHCAMIKSILNNQHCILSQMLCIVVLHLEFCSCRLHCNVNSSPGFRTFEKFPSMDMAMSSPPHCSLSCPHSCNVYFILLHLVIVMHIMVMVMKPDMADLRKNIMLTIADVTC